MFINFTLYTDVVLISSSQDGVCVCKCLNIKEILLFGIRKCIEDTVGSEKYDVNGRKNA